MNKARLLCLTLIIMLVSLLFAGCSGQSDEIQEAEYVYVTGAVTTITLHESPSKNSPSLAEFETGKKLRVDEWTNDNFIYVHDELSDVYGYITTKHITEDLDAVCKAEKYYTSETASVYKDAHDTSNAIDTLKKGKKVTVIEKPLNGMWRIKYDDSVGYIDSSSLTKKKTSKTSNTSGNQNYNKNGASSNKNGDYYEPDPIEPDPGDPDPDPGDPDPDPGDPEDPWDPGFGGDDDYDD